MKGGAETVAEGAQGGSIRVTGGVGVVAGDSSGGGGGGVCVRG